MEEWVWLVMIPAITVNALALCNWRASRRSLDRARRHAAQAEAVLRVEWLLAPPDVREWIRRERRDIADMFDVH